MSDVIESTFSSISRLLTDNIAGSPPKSTKTNTVSKGFEHFIRAVSCARNKHEEEGLFHRELSLLKQRFSQPDVSTSQMREYMARIVFCSMLGYDVNFACIHAVKLAQHGKLQEKRTGYLAASLLLHEDHELILLLINTIQKDLSSSNILENCMGLTAVCQLVNTEMVPMLLPSIIEKLKHPRELVRKKAVMCLQKFHHQNPPSVQHLTDKFRQALSDKDPGVMATSLHIYLQIFQCDATPYLGLTTGFINTLYQVINRKLPQDFEYNSIPAPWVQIKLLKILATLGATNERTSSLMYEVLKETLQRATVKDNAAFAILYECVVTITTIWPNEELLYSAATCVGKFLRSKGNNFRYLGLKALGHLVKCGAQYATDYQMIVVECLDDTDPAIQRQTYDLLYRMTNKSNVDVICNRLLQYLTEVKNNYLREDLINKITQIIDNFAPDPQWYIVTMNRLMEVSGEQTQTLCFKSLINAIQKGCHKNEANSGGLRDFVVRTYFEHLQSPKLSTSLLNTTVWAICEYSKSVHNSDLDPKVISENLCRHYHQTFDSSRHYILSGLQKMFISGLLQYSELLEVLTKLESSTKGNNLCQRIKEISRMGESDSTLIQALRTQNGADNSKMDYTLSFLDDYVTEALEDGGVVYRPRFSRQPENKKHTEMKSLFGDIQYDKYSSSGAGNSIEGQDIQPLEGSTDSPQSGNSDISGREGLNMSGVKRVWGSGGLIQADRHMTIPESLQNYTIDRDVSEVSAVTTNSQEDMLLKERRRKEELAKALFRGFDSSPPTIKDSSSSLKTDLSESNMAEKLTQSEEIKLLVKQKPKDGHDWRTVKKSSTNVENLREDNPTSDTVVDEVAEIFQQTPIEDSSGSLHYSTTLPELQTDSLLEKPLPHGDNFTLGLSELQTEALSDKSLPHFGNLISEVSEASLTNTSGRDSEISMYEIFKSELTEQELSDFSKFGDSDSSKEN